ncbi:hypothetical protein ABZZ20_34375 [Streptomyces sp. NPDC006430]|uniref:hypothetical protein n=1 Tax=Streptomyces sp. NPDC006430 TaxID=3154299 RepID=UPI0033B2E2FA
MSRYTEVIVLARGAEKVMEPLTRPDEDREWYQSFIPVHEGVFDGSRMPSDDCWTWVIQFGRRNWHGLLGHLESLAWPYPYSVQVLVRDEDDDCFGLWMIYDGKLVEVPLPRTERTPFDSVTGVLTRLDRPRG